MDGLAYQRRRGEIQTYFDRTAVDAWKRFATEAPLGRIRATVREGRARMRAIMLASLPNDLSGWRILDAGCGTGAMSIELARRALGSPDQVNQNPQLLKRSLELSAYFTIPKIEVPHRQLALLNAMNLAKRSRNYNTALSFANRILANGGASKILESVSPTT